MFKINRRQFLIASAQAVTGIIICRPVKSFGKGSREVPLTFFHTHTGEHLKIVHSTGRRLPSVQKKISSFLRDFRTGDIHPIDPFLLDIIGQVQKIGGSRGTIEVISGYRSPLTNRFLHAKSGGVAKKSLHMKGQAIDIRISDIPTKDLRDIAVSLKCGGVGYYSDSDFVHLDTGDFRTW